MATATATATAKRIEPRAVVRLSELMDRRCPRKAHYAWHEGPDRRGIQPKGRQDQNWNIGIYAHIRAAAVSRAEAEERFARENPALVLDPLETDRVEALAQAGLMDAFRQIEKRGGILECEVRSMVSPIAIHPDMIVLSPKRDRVLAYHEFKTTDVTGIHRYTRETRRLSPQVMAAATLMQPDLISVHVWARPTHKKKDTESAVQYIQRLVETVIRPEPERFYKRLDFGPQNLIRWPEVHLLALIPLTRETDQRECIEAYGRLCPFAGPCLENEPMTDQFEPRPPSPQDAPKTIITVNEDAKIMSIEEAPQ